MTFGMAANEVEMAWGTPTRMSKNHIGERTEVRDGCVIAYDAQQNLVAEIGFPSSIQSVDASGSSDFPIDSRTNDLAAWKFHSEAYEGDGFIVFPHLGVSPSGFGSNDFQLRTATAF